MRKSVSAVQLCVWIVLLGMIPAAGFAALDAFIEIEGVKGESTDSKHTDWIDLLSFNWGLSVPGSTNTATGGSRLTAGRASFQDLTFTKRLDKSSPFLALYCCQGKHIPKVKLEIAHHTGGQKVYYVITMKDVLVTSVNVGGQAGGSDAFPLESIGLRFGDIQWEYWPSDSSTGELTGSKIESGWSIVLEKQL